MHLPGFLLCCLHSLDMKLIPQEAYFSLYLWAMTLTTKVSLVSAIIFKCNTLMIGQKTSCMTLVGLC